MLKYIIAITLCTYSSLCLHAQTYPVTLVENAEILDVIIQDNTTFYASFTDLIRVESDNSKTILDDRSGDSATLKGQFIEKQNGWYFLGWDYLSTDVVLPILLLREYDGDTTTNYTISFLDDLFNDFQGTIEGVSFQSKDSIFLLMKNFTTYKIIGVNTQSEIFHTVDLDINQLRDLKYLQPNLHLIVGKESLFLFNNEVVVKEKDFNTEIIDLKTYPNGRIEVLTNTNMYWLDVDLNIIKTIPLLSSNRTPVASFTSDNRSYLIETENDQSYILTLDTLGNLIAEFEEIPNMKYKGLYVHEKKFAIWGFNKGCNISGHSLKLDEIHFESTIPTNDISMNYLDISLDSIRIDTTYSNNNISIHSYYVYKWELEVSNKGLNAISDYRVGSRKITFGAPTFIQFDENESLEIGKSRTHNGSFEYYNEVPYVSAWVGTPKIDSDCSDNSLNTILLTPTLEENEINSFYVYPNPANNYLTIDNSTMEYVNVFDTNGALVLNQPMIKNERIDISVLKPGLYFLFLYSNNSINTIKFVKI
ncbi:MAG: T9SS type A sorting domain-containing protein [Saprospiraceae bacterium]|nr:T9SS type A sorting domain-containing protein [Saprospiraceae bacterium]